MNLNEINAIKAFLTNENLLRIVQTHQQNLQNKEDVGFNAFVLASDHFKKENFHSDILRAILDPEGTHNEKHKFLHLFIDLLNQISEGKTIAKSDFQNSVVVREEARIDVLIRDDISKKAIIIENKINNAVDMDRQIPRYFEEATKKELDVVAIVYLPLQAGKTPDKSTWQGDDKKNVEPLLKILPAYASNMLNLYEHWLLPCAQQAQDFDAVCVLRQYAKLVKSLNINSLDMISMEEFYDFLQADSGLNLQKALTIQKILEDMPLYLAERIKAKYESNFLPFPYLWIHGKNKLNAYPVFFSTIEYPPYRLQIEIQCKDLKVRLKNEDVYSIFFRDVSAPQKEIIADFLPLPKLPSLSKFISSKDKEYEIVVNTDTELELFEIIDAILKDLRSLSLK